MKVVSTICGLLSLFATFACHNPKRSPTSDLSPPYAPITQQKQAKPGDGGTVSGLPTGEWNRVDTGEVFHFTSNAMVSTKEGKQAFDRIEKGSVIYGSGSFKVVPSPDSKILDVYHGTEEFYLIRSGIDDAEVQGGIDLAVSGLSLAGDTRIAIISDISLRNLSEDTTVISGKPSVDGTFAIQNVQSGSYSVVANTTDGTKIAVIDDLRVERKQQKAGNISTPRTAHNFKTMISPGADLIYEGTQYSGSIHVKNIGTAMVPGANYSIAVPSNLIVTSKARDILGSINAGATKEIPFTFKAIGLDDDQVEIEVPITITDTSNNKWLDYVYLTVFKQPFSTYITANRKSVSGFISYLDNKLVHFTVPAGKTSSVEVPYVYGRPYSVVLSAPDLTAETEYGIGIGKTPSSDFSSFRDTGAFEPNNLLSEAHDLTAGEEAKAYLHAGDIDFFRFALSRPTEKITNIKSGDLVANDSVKIQGTCSDDGGDVVLILKKATSSTIVKCEGRVFSANVNFVREASGPETLLIKHLNTLGFQSKTESISVQVDEPMILINGGSVFTNLSSVTLAMRATDATEMYVTNSGGCVSGGAWETYSSSRYWNINPSNGRQSVFVKFRGSNKIESACLFATILHLEAPSAPAVTASSTAMRQMTFSWTNPGNTIGGTIISDYNLVIGTSPDASDVFSGKVSGPSKTISAAEGVTYYTKVQSIDTSGNHSLFSLTSTAVLSDSRPPIPGNGGVITAVAGKQNITLSWAPGSDDNTPSDAIIYKSYYSKSNANMTTLTDVMFSTQFPSPTPQSTSVTITGLTDLSNYTFNVIAQDQAGNKSVYQPVTARPINELWTWISGSNTTNQQGFYGTKGIPSTANYPGARSSSVSWQDASGNLWLFGGYGYGNSTTTSGSLNDLWKFNPTNSTWTWVSGYNSTGQVGNYGSKGIPSNANYPGARYGSISWVDTSGNLWLFGGFGNSNPTTSGYLNDLWKYNPTNATWTWVSGSSTTNQFGVYGTRGIQSNANFPGARYGSVSWTDASGNLWLFGGTGTGTSTTTGQLNDLWKYSPTDSSWTWVSGSNNTGQMAFYGTKGTSSTANYPGARSYSSSWTDSSGNLWLFGGTGKGTSGTNGLLNDLWKYNPTDSTWTWVSGSSNTDQLSSYGTKGIPSTANYPGARSYSSSWTDSSGNLWLFGGAGYGSSTHGNLNDLWKFNPTLSTWTWVTGSSEANQGSSYGTRGIIDNSNLPGASYFSSSWIDSTGNLWLFGGLCTNTSTTTCGYLNHLWRFTP